MAILLKKVNIDFTDGIALLATLYQIANFKLCNKHQFFLARHLGFITNWVSKENVASQMDVIWQYCNLLNFKLLICNKPKWFWKQVQEYIGEINKSEQLLFVSYVGNTFYCLFLWFYFAGRPISISYVENTLCYLFLLFFFTRKPMSIPYIGNTLSCLFL